MRAVFHISDTVHRLRQQAHKIWGMGLSQSQVERRDREPAMVDPLETLCVAGPQTNSF
jgi:hypothetical protein